MVNDGASLEAGQNLPSTFGEVYEQGVGLCHTKIKVYTDLYYNWDAIDFSTFPLTATLNVQRSVVGYGNASDVRVVYKERVIINLCIQCVEWLTSCIFSLWADFCSMYCFSWQADWVGTGGGAIKISAYRWAWFSATSQIYIFYTSCNLSVSIDHVRQPWDSSDCLN